MFWSSVIHCVTLLLVITTVHVKGSTVTGTAFNDVNWSNLTSSELSELDPTVFENVTADDIHVIPTEACDGFKGPQIESMNISATAGFTRDCFNRISPGVTSFLNALQIQNLSPLGACQGFTSEQLKQLNSNAYTGFTPDCLGEFKVDTCNEVSNQMINEWTEDQFKGFKTVCIENWNLSVIIQMNTNQFTWFQPEQLQNFSINWVLTIPPAVFSRFTVSQIANFQSSIASQFTFQQLEQLYLVYTTTLLSGVPRAHFYLTPISTIQIFKNNITQDKLPQLLNHTDSELTDPATYNWLIVTAIRDSEIAAVLAMNNFTFIQTIRPEAINGLRSGQVVNLLDAEVFANINGTQAYNLLPDVLSAMTTHQYQSLTPDALKGINPSYIDDIPQDVYSHLNCPQIEALKDQHYDKMSNKENYRKQLVLCTFGLFSDDALLTGFGIAFACAVLLTILGLFVVRKKNQFEYVALHNK